MQLAFYKGKGNFVDFLIRWWTKSRFSHVELVFSDQAWFSSTRSRGTHIEWSPQTHMMEWEYLNVPMSQEQERAIKLWCLKENSKKYDYIGILFSQIFSFKRHNENKWFCSEICLAALQHIGLHPNYAPHNVSPGRLYNIIKQSIHSLSHLHL